METDWWNIIWPQAVAGLISGVIVLIIQLYITRRDKGGTGGQSVGNVTGAEVSVTQNSHNVTQTAIIQNIDRSRTIVQHSSGADGNAAESSGWGGPAAVLVGGAFAGALFVIFAPTLLAIEVGALLALIIGAVPAVATTRSALTRWPRQASYAVATISLTVVSFGIVWVNVFTTTREGMSLLGMQEAIVRAVPDGEGPIISRYLATVFQEIQSFITIFGLQGIGFILYLLVGPAFLAGAIILSCGIVFDWLAYLRFSSRPVASAFIVRRADHFRELRWWHVMVVLVVLIIAVLSATGALYDLVSSTRFEFPTATTPPPSG